MTSDIVATNGQLLRTRPPSPVSPRLHPDLCARCLQIHLSHAQSLQDLGRRSYGEEVARELPISYAMPQLGSTSIGRHWAWPTPADIEFMRAHGYAVPDAGPSRAILVWPPSDDQAGPSQPQVLNGNASRESTYMDSPISDSDDDFADSSLGDMDGVPFGSNYGNTIGYSLGADTFGDPVNNTLSGVLGSTFGNILDEVFGEGHPDGSITDPDYIALMKMRGERKLPCEIDSSERWDEYLAGDSASEDYFSDASGSESVSDLDEPLELIFEDDEFMEDDCHIEEDFDDNVSEDEEIIL